MERGRKQFEEMMVDWFMHAVQRRGKRWVNLTLQPNYRGPSARDNERYRKTTSGLSANPGSLGRPVDNRFRYTSARAQPKSAARRHSQRPTIFTAR